MKAKKARKKKDKDNSDKVDESEIVLAENSDDNLEEDSEMNDEEMEHDDGEAEGQKTAPKHLVELANTVR